MTVYDAIGMLLLSWAAVGAVVTMFSDDPPWTWLSHRGSK